MSFALTTAQIKARTKDVTRRLGWLDLKRGDLIRAVVKCMGLKPGEKIQPLAVIRVKSVNRERLGLVTKFDVKREGFPELTPSGFIKMFCEHMDADEMTVVTRIEFEYVEGGDALQLPLIQ